MELLQRLLRDGPVYLELGVVLMPPLPSTIPGAATGARTGTLTLAHRRPCEARVANMGQGVGKGLSSRSPPVTRCSSSTDSSPRAS